MTLAVTRAPDSHRGPVLLVSPDGQFRLLSPAFFAIAGLRPVGSENLKGHPLRPLATSLSSANKANESA